MLIYTLVIPINFLGNNFTVGFTETLAVRFYTKMFFFFQQRVWLGSSRNYTVVQSHDMSQQDS